MKLFCHRVSPGRMQAVQTSGSPLGPTRSLPCTLAAGCASPAAFPVLW